jgi:CheY-like chemotaxis protein
MVHPMAAQRPKSVLVVDDHPLMRESFCAALQAAGYEVFEAANGREALAVLPKVGRPCVILLDLEMPVMDGAEFLRRLRQRPDGEQFQIILCTASRHAPLPGVREVLPKQTISLDRLLASVSAACH